MKTQSGRVVVVLPWSFPLSLSLSLCLCPTGRDTSFIVCPTYSNFTSVTDQIELARATNLLFSCAQASPSVRREWVYLLCEDSGSKFWYIFFHLRENKRSSNLCFTPSWLLTCGALNIWTYTSWTAYLLWEDSGAKFGLFFFGPSRDKKIPLT